MVYGYSVLSPVLRAFWPPSSLRSLLLKNLTPASGCQDHTALHVRFKRPRQKHYPRPPHPAPRFVTLRNAPLSGRDQITIVRVQIAVKRYFCKTENNLRNSEPAIPGREPAIYTDYFRILASALIASWASKPMASAHSISSTTSTSFCPVST